MSRFKSFSSSFFAAFAKKNSAEKLGLILIFNGNYVFNFADEHHKQKRRDIEEKKNSAWKSAKQT
jgi:hypothetical protein